MFFPWHLLITLVAVISVPLYLLYKVRITPQRKITYASILCLSIFMVIICVIRMAAGVLPGGTGDQVWIIFWTAIESTTAVVMVSLTAYPRLLKRARANRAAAAGNAFIPSPWVVVRAKRRLERSSDWFRTRVATRAAREEVDEDWVAGRENEAGGVRQPRPVLLQERRRSTGDVMLSSSSSAPPKESILLERWVTDRTV